MSARAWASETESRDRGPDTCGEWSRADTTCWPRLTCCEPTAVPWSPFTTSTGKPRKLATGSATDPT